MPPVSDQNSGGRLLPEDGYPKHLDAAALDRVDQQLRELLPFVPDEPGSYQDCDGDRWILGTDGSWTDRHGVTRGPEWGPLIGLFTPMAAIPNSKGLVNRRP